MLAAVVATLAATAAHPDEAPNVWPPAVRNEIRASAEAGSMVAAGLVIYAIDRVTNHQPYEFELSLETLGRKLTDPDYTRFDTSSPFHNALGHTYLGTLHYNAWRSNGFGPIAAYTFATLTALFWEYVIEYREVASINDLVFQAASPIALGEPGHLLSLAMAGAADGPLARLIMSFVDPWMSLNSAIDGRSFPALPATTRFELETWISGSAGLRDGLADGGEVVAIGFRSSLTQHTRGPSRALVLAAGAPHAELAFETGASAEGPRLLTFLGRTALLGAIWRPPGAGLTTFGGAGVLVEHETRLLQRWTDYHTIAGVGPIVFVEHAAGPLHLELRGDAYGTFGLVRAFAIDAYRQIRDTSATRTPLREHGYNYTYGVFARAEAGVGWGGLRLAATARRATFASIQGRDRLQERITDDFPVADSRDLLSGSLTYTIGGFGLSAAFERRSYRGEIDPVIAADIDDRVVLRFIYLPAD